MLKRLEFSTLRGIPVNEETGVPVTRGSDTDKSRYAYFNFFQPVDRSENPFKYFVGYLGGRQVYYVGQAEPLQFFGMQLPFGAAGRENPLKKAEFLTFLIQKFNELTDFSAFNMGKQEWVLQFVKDQREKWITVLPSESIQRENALDNGDFWEKLTDMIKTFYPSQPLENAAAVPSATV